MNRKKETLEKTQKIKKKQRIKTKKIKKEGEDMGEQKKKIETNPQKCLLEQGIKSPKKNKERILESRKYGKRFSY